MRYALKILVAAGTVVAGSWLFVPADPVRAQGYGTMSCSQLWYARNKIYADNGYCFRTARGRRTFGAGCFPPYGQLSGYDKSRVEEIRMWEGRRGC